jgi:hypothetical protein
MSCASSFEEYAESFGLTDIEKVFGIEDIQVDLKVYVKNFASRLSPDVEGRLNELLKTALGHPGQTLQITLERKDLPTIHLAMLRNASSIDWQVTRKINPPTSPDTYTLALCNGSTVEIFL